MSGSPDDWSNNRPLVCDTNVLLSALVSNSATRTLLVALDCPLVIPEQVLDELQQHRAEIREKSGLPKERFDRLLDGLLCHVQRLPPESIATYRSDAATAMAAIDPDDTVFVAAAIAVDGAVWSDDARLAEQTLVPTFTTTDIVEATDLLP